MSVEQNKAVVRSLLEAWNKVDASAINELTSSDFVHHILARGVDMDRGASRRRRRQRS